MRSRSSSLCLSLFLFIPSIATENCAAPRSANCCEYNSANNADFPVIDQSPTAVSCCFEGNLCRYSQGCVDSDMGNWSAFNGYASVSKLVSRRGLYVYSVLESPWVYLSTPTCVEFTYSRGTPYQLQVFLAFSNVEQPCLMEDSQGVRNYQNRTARFSIDPMTVKIQFRVQGGGAGPTLSHPKLYPIKVLEGGCPQKGGQSTASWANHRHTSTQCRQVSVTTVSSSTSHPTASSTTGPTSTVGNMTSPDSITSSGRPQSTSTLPGTATSSPEESHTASDRTDPIWSPVCHMSPPGKTTAIPTGNVTPDGESDNSAAVIAGVMVTAVVLVVVIIVVVIVYRRKRHQSKPDDDNENTEDLSMTAGGTITGNTTTERRGNPFSRRDGDYTDIDLATTPSSDINPCELAEDATNTNGSFGPNLERLNGSKEDDYSRIDEAQPAAVHSRGKNTEQVKPNPNDVYSVVNKPGKKTPTPEYSLAKIVGEKPTLPNPNDVYSVVNKKGKKFEPATKQEQPDTEYNTISHNGNNTSSQKAPGDTTCNPYNRIGAVSSIGLNENSRASTTPEDGLLTDDYNKLNLAGNGSMKEKSRAAGAAYDHVRNDPDDAYSKARIGKRNVVIDSGYHRLKP